ncbi:MAG: PAS-domain containing protein [Xanthobacter sp.]
MGGTGQMMGRMEKLGAKVCRREDTPLRWLARGRLKQPLRATTTLTSLAFMCGAAMAGPTAPAVAASAAGPGPSDVLAAGHMPVWAGFSLISSPAAWLAVAAAGALLAGVAVFMREQRRAQQALLAADARAEEAEQRAARARADAYDARALLSQSAPCALIWLRGEGDVRAFGMPKAERAAWLGVEGAAAVEKAVALLRSTDGTLDQPLRAPDGRMFRLVGRTLNGAGMVLVHPGFGEGEGVAVEAGAPLQAGLRAMLDAAPTPAWLRSADGPLLYANPAFLDAVGASSLEQARTDGLDLLDSKSRAAAESAEQGAGAFRGRVRAVAHGQRRQMDVVETAGPFGIAGMAVDVTEEAAARAETSRVVTAHRNTLDHLTTAVAIFGPDERLVFHNTAYEQLFDFSPAFLDQRPSDSEILESLRTRRKVPEQADFRAWRAQLREAYRALEPVNDWWYLPGNEVLRVVITPNAEGGVTYLFDDLTEYVSLESRFNSLNRIQGETLDGLAEAVAVFGSDGRLRLYNLAFLKLWQLDAAALGNKPHVDAVAALCRPLHGESSAFSRIRSVVTAMEHREAETMRIERPDGKVVDSTAQPLPDGGTMVTFRDVTDSVKVERALIERAEALEAADRLKNAFVGHVSYHLRTPLNTLMGYADMMREGMAGPLNERQREYLDHMHHSSDLLRALIDDILDLATIDAGAMELEMTQIDVREMLEGVADAIQDQIRAAGVHLALDVSAQVGHFTADPRRVRQILFNLLSNAITASPQGGTVTLGAVRRDERLVLSVRDEGAGVPQELVETLFQRFESRSANPDHRGVGLGLSIARSFMELHGGSIRLEQSHPAGTHAICEFLLSAAPQRHEVAA